MIDKTYLADVLPLLRLNGVRSFKVTGLEIEFYVEHTDQPASSITKPTDNDSIQAIADTIRKQEEAMPPDLRADSLMDEDKILNWSSPDQPQEQPDLALTGERPL